MNFEINYLAAPRASTPAFSYDAEAKVLVPLIPAVSFTQGVGEFNITVNGDYPLVYDSEGLLVGDVTMAQKANLYPRLEFILVLAHKYRARIASLTQEGLLIVPSVTESAVLPADSLNLLDLVAIHPQGVTAVNVNEAWFLATEGNYVCTGGQLIRVRV